MLDPETTRGFYGSLYLLGAFSPTAKEKIYLAPTLG